jgi:hypothetical protein
MDKQRLQQPTPSPRLLEKILEHVIHQLELVSQVRAARIGSETAHLKPGSSPPPGRPTRTREMLMEQYQQATNNWERLEVIKYAQRLLSAARDPRDLSLRRGTRQWKEAIANDTRTSAIVARDFGISPSYVRKLRRRHHVG